jgi:maltooligosyltrehalose trehalohydrolase
MSLRDRTGAAGPYRYLLTPSTGPPLAPVRLMTRSFAVGAELIEGGVDFRVWAPSARRVTIEIEGHGLQSLEREQDGYWHIFVASLQAGALYRYRLDERGPFPDPASRFQPSGPFGPSEVIDPTTFSWSDEDWHGPDPARQVIYEMHVGTFTADGTYEAASEHLESLAEIGLTTIELMPVAEFPGRFGWGYDGVALWAPTRLYGRPDELRRFVDHAHRVGLAVVLDVVYNHLGPAGNFLAEFSPDYFTDRYPNEWGAALNFDGLHSGPVREFFISNASAWISEFHLDGLRLDATQSIHDASDRHVIAEISECAREAAAGRRIWIVAENEPQDIRTILPAEQQGHGLDAIWNDDFHHSAVVALTGRNDAYYMDYFGKPQEFVSAARYGFLYQGQRYTWQNKRRGTPTGDVEGHRFVCCLENHDQVANSARGERLWRLTDRGSWRAMTALLLLGPWTPMLFQGQEFESNAPFLYFADHEKELADAVAKGRKEFLTQFRSLATREMAWRLPRPEDEESFERCKLDAVERTKHRAAVSLHRDLLRLQREDAAFAGRNRHEVEGAVLSAEAFVLRWMRGGDEDRLLIVNLGRDLHLNPAPEPLLAPPIGRRWAVLWSSESPAYGGSGTPEPDPGDGPWHLRGRAAVVLEPRPLNLGERQGEE